MSESRPPEAVGLSPGEVLLVAVLAVAVAAGVVVWLGAVLAAALEGARPPGGVGDAVRAIPRLVSAPGRPTEVWSKVTGRQVALPPAAVYWLATALAAIAVVAVLLGLRTGWRAVSLGKRRRLGVEVHARFASRRELRPLLVRRPVPGRFVLGSWGRWLVATESHRWAANTKTGVAKLWARLTGEVRHGRPGDVTSVAIVGPTRSGKTAECAIPGVLDWVGPAILLSVKRDLMDTTIARRRRLGEVRVFDPGGFLEQNENPHVTVTAAERARWSPLRNAHTATGAKRAGEALAAWTPQAGVEGGMSFWTSQGKLLFTGLLGAAGLDPKRSMAEVAQWVFNMSMPGDGTATCRPAEILEAAIDDADPGVREAAEAAILHLAAIWNKPDDRIKASVYSTAVTVCDPWLDPHVIAATDIDADDPGDWVDLGWLMDTGPDGDRANTLYLLVSNDDYRRLSPVLAGLLSDLKAQAYQWEMYGRPFPAPLLMLIDEAGNMPLDWLPEVSSTCAGIGIQLVTVWQSLAQIDEAYGRRADVLLTNHATKLFFPAASDDSTLGYQSKIVGDEEVERRSWSTDVTGGTHRRSISGQGQREPLVPYFLSRLPRFGQALMIHSNTPPAQITGRQWWRIPRLAEMVPHADPPARSWVRRAVLCRQASATEPSTPGPWTPTTARAVEANARRRSVAAGTVGHGGGAVARDRAVVEEATA
jgi:type IV secretion system protein VirD4